MTTDEQVLDELIGSPMEADCAIDESLRARLVADAERTGLLDVAYRTVESPLGPLLLAATPAGVVRVAFEGEGHDAVLAVLAEQISPRILHAPGSLDGPTRQLDEYFAGARRAFDVPVDLSLAHGFRRKVLDHLRTIAYGTTESYTVVALSLIHI